MLINKLTLSEDYAAALKLRCRILSAMLGVGLIGVLCSFLLLPGSDLPDFVQGFYLGGGSGLSAASLILLLRVRRLLKDPDARRRARISLRSREGAITEGVPPPKNTWRTVSALPL